MNKCDVCEDSINKNGKLVCKHPSGYSVFECEKAIKNLKAILLNTTKNNINNK